MLYLTLKIINIMTKMVNKIINKILNKIISLQKAINKIITINNNKLISLNRISLNKIDKFLKNIYVYIHINNYIVYQF